MEQRKYVLFAFSGDPLCFGHALLNVLDLHEKGYDTMLIIEGAATRLLSSFEEGTNQFSEQFFSCIEHGLISGVCSACSYAMKTREIAKRMKLTLLADMHGHPGMEEYIEAGYNIITI
jgi:hypothetical protein